MGGLELGQIWSFTRDVCVRAAEAADHVRGKPTMAIGMLKVSTKTFTVCVCVARLILKCLQFTPFRLYLDVDAHTAEAHVGRLGVWVYRLGI